VAAAEFADDLAREVDREAEEIAGMIIVPAVSQNIAVVITQNMCINSGVCVDDWLCCHENLK